jgi:hypothetical protein
MGGRIVVEQAEILVETFRLTDRHWNPRRYDSLDETVVLESVDLAIPMREIYRLVFS